MTCSRCRKSYSTKAQRCPHCGHVNAATGVFQTSTVLVSTQESDGVYRSVDEVPAPLRSRLIQSTNSANSATILIADRRGRREIARAMRSLPSTMQRKLMQAVVGTEPEERTFTPRQRRLAAVAGVLLALIAWIVWLLFSQR